MWRLRPPGARFACDVSEQEPRVVMRAEKRVLKSVQDAQRVLGEYVAPGARGRPVRDPDFSVRMVHPGAVVSVLAADFHVAATLLDRLLGPPFASIDVPAVRLASSLGFRGVRGQDISPDLEPRCDFRNPAACGCRAVRRL
jgi:hypothetical protein